MKPVVPHLKALQVRAQHLNATANLMKEQRLNQKAENLQKIGHETERAEAKLPKTSDALSKLGAGSEFGTTP